MGAPQVMATPAIGEPLELRSKSFEILGVFRGTAQRMKQRLCAEPLTSGTVAVMNIKRGDARHR